MKYSKILTLVLVSLFLGTNMIGCNKNVETIKSETPYYKLDIDAEKEYYPETYEEIDSIKQLMTDFYGYSVETDYRNDLYLNQLSFYTSEIRAMDEETDYKEVVREMTVGNEIVRNLIDCGVLEIEFYNANDAERADATCYYSYDLVNGAPEYLETIDQEIGGQYKATAIVELEKQSDVWRIIEFTVTDRVKTN